MECRQLSVKGDGIRFSAVIDEREVGRTFLYILHNDLHQRPFGLVEDVFVEEKSRGRGIATFLVRQAIETAKQNNCYKIILTCRTSREYLHPFYERMGFRNYGLEFRLDF